MKTESIAALVIVILVLAGLSVAGVLGARYSAASTRAESAEATTNMQAKIIQLQTDQLAAFRAISISVQDKNKSVDASAEERNIEYRTILKREKTCDMPVPADVAFGLLEYANRLRASALGTNSAGTDSGSSGAVAAGSLTYCQAILWIRPLLAAIEKANNQLAGIRQIEQTRQEKTK